MQRLWFKFTPLFRRFMVSYLIILMIPQIAGYASYRASIEAARTSSIENSLKSLNLGKEIIERNLMQVEDFTRQLAINQELYRLIADPKPLDANNVYGLGRMQRSLSMYSSTNDYLSHFFIYIPNYNVIITPTTVYYRPEHYYATNALEGMTFEEWKENILKKPHLNEIIPLRNYKQEIRSNLLVDAPAITFLQSLPLNSFNKPQATIGVMIDENQMASLTQHIVEQYGGWTLVTDANGNIIFSRGMSTSEAKQLKDIPAAKDREVQPMGDGRLLISIRSDQNGWNYMAGIPERALMIKADQIKQVTFTFTLATLGFGLIIGLLLAYRNSAPIHKLLFVFRDQNIGLPGKISNEYDFLASNITSLITNNHLLKNALNEQLPMLRDGFIKRLLNGEFYTTRELEAISSQTDISLHTSRGVVGIMRVDGYGSPDSEEIIQELSVARLIVREALTTWNADVLITEWGTDQIAFVLPLRDEALDQTLLTCEAQLMKLMDSVYQDYRVSTTIGIGSSYDVWNDVGRSFNEARQALEYAIHIGADQLVKFENAVKETELYYYPMESEQRLINTLKAGEMEESKRNLDQLFSRNFAEQELSYDMTQQFIMELRGTFLKLEPKIMLDEALVEEFKNRITGIQVTDSVAVLRDKFHQLAEEVCQNVQRKKSNMHAEIVNETMAYIQKHYTDANLTVYRIAEQMGKPEKYISQLFKEHTGENLSDYVEVVRISKAAELLLESQQTIDEIAQTTGYNSAHSFRRAFKRVRGILPSAFRQMEDQMK
ncbi:MULTISPECIES: helix-turn-helix domain-containing protein [unclassified Paenibacillus]|uniref:helix-turn-helix domain-containing protein n=1 Tax=unclassified Paenibacillus TaxID=185978 RepID=UPI00040A2C7A|nr:MULTISPECIES: helix-turn-helix domain-containing protein [unclassified Paenibacillus]KGP78856.1 AraC family transcriptional regulator [Paenibacillus sp. MAEPY2]KGP88664.1 AraC family transcriptional regulator [Paenibacillus sp. MAEPY1]